MSYSNDDMASNRSYTQSVPIQTSFYYGWCIVFISGLGIFFSGPGQAYSNSVFIELYMRDFHMDRTTVSSLYSLATLTAGFLLFAVGKLTGRFGHRVMMTWTAVLLGLACWWNSFVAGTLTLFIGFFMIRLLGQGSMFLIPNTLVSQWFVKQRGRALSYAGLGGLLGAAIFPPLNNWLIQTFSWPAAWRVLGAAILCCFAPAAFFLVRNKPEDVGLLPDHMLPGSDQASSQAPAAEDAWTLREAMRTKSFWLIMGCTAVPPMIYGGITIHIFSILNEHGIDRTTIAWILSFIPLISFACSLIAGFIVERVKVHAMLGLTFVINLLAPILLIAAQSEMMIFLFAVAWGVGQGLINVPLGVIWANYYGRRHLAQISGMTTFAMVFGSAVGPMQLGFAYDRLGNYNPVLWLMIFFWAAGAVFAFAATPPQRSP
ncbi:MFS transporter [Paenibacillus naphthalenovorans]|uniref:MFS transporter n=1 Tax=Paenibacillus naphthalenovorans TaxID=162209 RepID=UPI000892142D|nr:MFS transporter [Paenibacillus naphthalenovorans]SDI22278.1 Sugar phosphate permease [Paenibacillus naphthalenovorans]